MCLSVPARVLHVDPSGWRARVDYLGSSIEVGTALLENVQPGQHVLVHAGEAIQVIDADLAAESLAAWKELLKET